ncbi:MAG: HutD family protein [Clostridiales bacterium]|nr:HutD family protein [Clostridiales bacterium]
MAYSINVLRRHEQSTNKWSGGTTTQLAIYPENAEYDKRNFLWRISSAKVEVEESTFTSLPGIKRIIMVLDGKLHLHHEGHHNIDLDVFQQDTFSGDWNTKSYGKVTDFNLMMNEDSDGALEAIGIKGNDSKEILSNKSVEAYYCVKGEVQVTINGTELIKLCEGDFLLIDMHDHEEIVTIKLSNLEDMTTQLVRTMLDYKTN